MANTLTIRNIDPDDLRWLKSEARRRGVSVSELVRRIIKEFRERFPKGSRSRP